MKKGLLLLVVLLAACSSRELHTDISSNNTIVYTAEGCTTDADCTLHDSKYTWSCCWQGRCDVVNYSEDKWLALNANWLEQEKAKWCPKDCGPAPMCPTKVVNDAYEAKCINSICVKVGE